MTSDLAAFRAHLTAHLDWFAERGTKVRFWWRDDDAIAPTPALERLLAAANAHDVDVGLAVIPKTATQALADRLRDEPHAVVLQHGWQHLNHQRKDLGEKAAEFGDRRAPEEALAELVAGRERLEALFPAAFVPAFVPPWNRIAPPLARQLADAGLKGLSTFTWETLIPAQVQTHLDIIKWKKDRRFIGWASASERLELQFQRRRNTGGEPLGILTHHLDHDAGCEAFVEEFLAIAAHHPGAAWPRIADLFAEVAAAA
ncbi:MAG: polysaccharide deacetylase family protein [Pannonibacter sp.]